VHGEQKSPSGSLESLVPLPSHTHRTVSPARMRTVSGSQRSPPPAPTMMVGFVEMPGSVVVVVVGELLEAQELGAQIPVAAADRGPGAPKGLE
jgi:hypothetical protein